MNENIVKFIEKLDKDQDLLAKIADIRDADEAYDLASSVQDGFTKEEFVSAMKELASQVNVTELTDEDLEKYAGGGIDPTTLGATLFTAATLAALGAA